MATVSSIGGAGWIGMSGLGGPVWKKNDSKIYVVAYPSDRTSSFFLADLSKPKVHPEGAGYGIFVEPKKISKAKFWKGKGGEPTLLTVEGGGPAPGLTVRTGVQWGINGMLVRFMMDSKDDDGGRVNEVHEVLERVALNVRTGDEVWLREALIALVEAGLVRTFHIEEFIELAKSVVMEQMGNGARWDRVLTLDYESHIQKSNTI